ncbi:tight adherence protein C [Cytobacillus oceanisediminis]|uniref:Tight adherence protein C n=1 Tax=Cytobacillus oceanisediminis TaxID=665099 RepID=A0A2V2ZTR6_9BACI|nr:type II secretion system F family protein [Cytobacillus oceanisediminis]PWW27057.1 tight adherence protein C [Cytobacillus oceanisediminis]
MSIMYISIFISLSMFFYAMLAIQSSKKIHMEKRIQFFFEKNAQVLLEENEAEIQESFSERVLMPLWKNLKIKFQKSLDKEKTNQLELRLAQAGYPFGWSAIEFKIIQTSILAFMPILGFGFAYLLNLENHLKLLFSMPFFIVGFIAPSMFLKSKMQKRNKEALKEIPDTLDLLTISLEAGLGFDAALSKVVSKKSGVLSDEFTFALEEIRIGKTRKEALGGIQERLQIDELKNLIYCIVQAEKLGIGMVSVLRVQTEEIREKRKNRAEEAAMKAPIKMLFPLVLFIFPTLFIILLGPAILQFMESF